MYCIPNGSKGQKHTFSVLNLTQTGKWICMDLTVLAFGLSDFSLVRPLTFLRLAHGKHWISS
jgi:hypothetical protein